MKPAPAVILANAIIWGVVILAVSLKLKGTGLMPEVLPILGAGAGGTLVVTGGLLGRRPRE